MESGSPSVWIRGFVCLEMQNSPRDHSWLDKLTSSQVPVISELDTRALVLTLREQGSCYGAMVRAESEEEAKKLSSSLIAEARAKADTDWTQAVCCQRPFELKGKNPERSKRSRL